MSDAIQESPPAEAGGEEDVGRIAVVRARFSSFRTVPSRGAAALTMDVPLERAAQAMEVLGTPMLGETIHVAFTRVPNPAGVPPLHGTLEKVSMVAAREALSLSIEMPAELSHLALRQLSIPTKSSDIKVVIVRLLEQPERQTKPPGKSPGQLAVVRCALRVKDEPFQRFILGPSFFPGDASGNELDATASVRAQLGIKSRAELSNDHEKLREWWAMEARYEEWLQNGGLEISVARHAR